MFIKTMKPEETVQIRGEGIIKNISGNRIESAIAVQEKPKGPKL